jgi:hypothetical protein
VSTQPISDERLAEIEARAKAHGFRDWYSEDVPEVRAELLREVLSATYTAEGVETWLAAKADLSYDEQLRQAQSLKGMVAT